MFGVASENRGASINSGMPTKKRFAWEPVTGERPAGVVTATVRKPGGAFEVIKTAADTFSPPAPTFRSLAVTSGSATPSRKNWTLVAPPRAEPIIVSGTCCTPGTADDGVVERSLGGAITTETGMFVLRGPQATVTVPVPSERAVTTPLELTDATVGVDER